MSEILTYEDDPVSYRLEQQKHLAELEAFLAGRVYKYYVLAREVEIKATEFAIIVTDPVNRETEIESFKLRGELRNLEAMKIVFEDARVDLKARIEEMLEKEKQNASRTTSSNE